MNILYNNKMKEKEVKTNIISLSEEKWKAVYQDPENDKSGT